MLFTLPVLQADVVWWDDSRSPSAPAGKLLSDNEGWWGEQIATGTRYYFETPPQHPPDSPGKGRLLDGIPAGDLKVPVGASGEALVVVFDLQDPYRISEVQIATNSSESTCIVEYAAAEEGPWSQAETVVEKGNNPGFLRLRLDSPVEARYLRLRVKAAQSEIHTLSEVWIWGDAVSDELPTRNHLADDQRPPLEGMHYSFPGMKQTMFSGARLRKWRHSLAKNPGALWNPWQGINKAWLPDTSMERVKLTALRNGVDSRTLVLTASGEQPLEGKLSITPFTKKEYKNQKYSLPLATLSVGGIVETQRWGTTMRPLFTAENRLPAPLLNRFVLNPRQVGTFPTLHLPPGESMVIHLGVEADMAPAGIYHASINIEDSKVSLPVELEILDAELPAPPVWVNSWSGITPSMPFHSDERLRHETAYKRKLGITVWNDGPPQPGTLSEAIREHDPDLVYLLRIPKKIARKGWSGEISREGLSEEDAAHLRQHLRELIKETEALGLDRKRWFLELWDEPRARNVEGFAAVAKMVKEVEPSIRLYANPCFWIDMEKGFSSDDDVYSRLAPWYEKLVDISVVQVGLEDPARFPATYELFNRDSYEVRASYQHPHPHRRIIWKNFQRGWNGWGFYSYARPRGNPWNDFDAAEFDYQYVYPGPNGPISTFDSETFRACWEDYRLLTLLKERGIDTAPLLQEIPRCQSNEDFERLKEKALLLLKTNLKK